VYVRLDGLGKVVAYLSVQIPVTAAVSANPSLGAKKGCANVIKVTVAPHVKSVTVEKMPRARIMVNVTTAI